jgi:hypothetical protein
MVTELRRARCFRFRLTSGRRWDNSRASSARRPDFFQLLRTERLRYSLAPRFHLEMGCQARAHPPSCLARVAAGAAWPGRTPTKQSPARRVALWSPRPRSADQGATDRRSLRPDLRIARRLSSAAACPCASGFGSFRPARSMTRSSPSECALRAINKF